MKRKALIKIVILTFVFCFMGFSTAHAVMFRMLGAKDLGRAAATNGSMAFKGKVLKVEQTTDSQKITFQVQDVIKGNLKAGDVITLQFPDPKFNNNMRLSMGIPPPQSLVPGVETVLFTTTRMLDGKTLLIGGDQGQYYLSNEGGKAGVYNSLGNSNFFSEQEMGNPLMKKVVQGMQERNSGTIPYEDFKKLINQ